MNPCLAEDEVAAFEKAHGVTLPPEYRGFLLNVGNGGAGPAYGSFKLGEMDDGFDENPWVENDGFIGVLAEPFPLTSAWNDTSEVPVLEEALENDPEAREQYDEQFEAWERRYYDSARVNGAIPICHVGCALRQWLVITGPERGNVWEIDALSREVYILWGVTDLRFWSGTSNGWMKRLRRARATTGWVHKLDQMKKRNSYGRD